MEWVVLGLYLWAALTTGLLVYEPYVMSRWIAVGLGIIWPLLLPLGVVLFLVALFRGEV